MNINISNFGQNNSPLVGSGFPAPSAGMGFSPQNVMMMQMMTQMMTMMQMLFQQVLGSGGGSAMASPMANFGSPAASGGSGIGNFLGGSSGGAASGASSAAAAGPTTDLSQVKGSEFGKKFAAAAEKTANRINTPGWCLKGVNDTMQAMGMPVTRRASAYMALPDFQKSDRFQEIKVSRDQLKSLPAGAVVIWDKGAGLPHGHISVALGNGREASSTVRNQLNLKTNFHVFVPKG